MEFTSENFCINFTSYDKCKDCINNFDFNCNNYESENTRKLEIFKVKNKVIKQNNNI